MIKAIFFDIDGTLISTNGRVLESTQRAIAQAQKNGILCGVSTGRGPESVAHIVKELDLDMFITYNGQLVYTKTQTIYARPFEEKILQEIIHYADEHSRQMLLGGRHHMEGSLTMRIGQSGLVRKLIRFVPRWFPIRRMKLTLQHYSPNRRSGRYKILRKTYSEPIYQCVMLSGEYELAKLQNALPSCDFQRSNPYTIDIVPKGGSKLQGILFFLAHQGIDLSEAMAFGDHLNDIEMLQGVGIGVSMGNGMQEVKVTADYVTASNNEDGIEKALKHFQLI
ncbi:HAD-IIB family hydrolase [Candidatus Enterococcus willemsii]|uniref:Haloacid dehalogenase n=1 Tax=Candidatus Enterococcus willemsii TaxID=1857215 RepID=A0ABQ6YZA4_9ENTE|nr:HAD-IIB family hydrolase [Enterococcus sp. CU12B]KAF1303780.1 haloacid dehalogenase [Enterococcus sp. CU12B]